MSSPLHLPRAAGCTLAELLLTLLVATLLLSAGLPALRHLLLESRMTAAVNSLVHDLHAARVAAEVRARPVALCPAAPEQGCRLDGNWEGGWRVVVPAGPGEAVDTVARELAFSQPRPGVRLRSNRSHYVFRPGTRRDTNGTVSLCDERGTAAARGVVISPTGRPRLIYGRTSRERLRCGA